ncbi:MAG: Ig-like domain-containing protein [Bacteroidales bacterium]|nr:Ig-like domain-containing protein [Bacteroidales bacterium]
MKWYQLIIISTLVILASCARIVMPPGGPEDNTPPVIAKSFPLNGSTLFNADKIELQFDEYIVLKNFNQEFVSSPPLAEKPEKILKGKSLILKFDSDSLKHNTTYTFNFGNAISDFRNDNVISQFRYVFSTGEHLNSLQFEGHLFSAKEHKPEEKIWVLLYNHYTDSSLIKQKPDFVAKTDIDGHFNFYNIPSGTYGLAALNDINNNLIYDLPNEQIAFLDSTFVLKINQIIIPFDSLIADKLNNDTTQHLYQNDSTWKESISPEHIDLYLFEKEWSKQFIKSFDRSKKDVLSIYFNASNDSSLRASYNFDDQGKIMQEWNASKDSLRIFLLDTNISKIDTIYSYIDYFKTDTANILRRTIDTLIFVYKAPIASKKDKEKNNKGDTLSLSAIEYLTIGTNVSSSKSMDINRKIRFNFNFPIDKIDTSKIELFEFDDTLLIHQNFILIKDSNINRSYFIDQVLKENTKYRLNVLPGAFIDYRNCLNDTLDIVFKTKQMSSYTEIICIISGINNSFPRIIQLLDATGKVINSEIITEDGKLYFSFINPGNYNLKSITDWNNNGKWDTGDYYKKRQAEPVMFYKETIPTKANWSHEINWELGPINNHP